MAKNTDLVIVDVIVNYKKQPMEVDIGVSVTIFSKKTYVQLRGRTILCLHNINVELCTYNREALKICGCIPLNITYCNQTENLPLFVVGQEEPNLVKRD